MIAAQSPATPGEQEARGEGSPALPLADTSDINYDEPAPSIEDGDQLAVLRQLNWHAGKVKLKRSERADLEALYRAEMESLTERWQYRASVIDREITWHEAPIKSFHLAHSDRKTLPLPNGSSKLNEPKEYKAVVADETALTEWVRVNHPEIMKPPNITALRSVVKVAETEDGHVVLDAVTGEFVPGVEAKKGDTSWSLSTTPERWF